MEKTYSISIEGSGTLKELKDSIFQIGTQLELAMDSDNPIPNGAVSWEDPILMTNISEEEE